MNANMRREGVVDPHMNGEGPEARPVTTADLANPPHQDAQQLNVPADHSGGNTTPLLPDDEASELRRHWDAVQTGFVDEPRRSVEQADELVAGTMRRMAEIFSAERAQLESQWDRGDDVSTEDLRIALQRYRAFFGRLLSM